MKNAKFNFEKFIIIIYIIALMLAYFVNYKCMYIDFFIVGIFMCYRHIMIFIFGPQYKIRKKMKGEYKKYKKKDILDVFADIKKYYYENHFSTEELLSRKLELEKNAYIQENIIIGCFSGFIVSFLFFMINGLDIINIFKKDSGIIEYAVLSIFILILFSVATIFLLGLMHFFSFRPTKDKSVKLYLQEKELVIVLEKLNNRLEEENR